jgi:hypothetical protein
VISIKTCSKCGIEKPESEFYKRKAMKDGLKSECKTCSTLASKNWIDMHKDRWKDYRREYNKNYKQKKKSDLAFIEKRRIYEKTRNKIPEIKLRRNISKQLHRALNGHKNSKSWLKMFDYNIMDLKQHLENLFETGMTWENYGDWHIDHIRPQSSFDFTDFTQVKACWELSNLQPLWAKDNLQKSNRWSGDYGRGEVQPTDRDSAERNFYRCLRSENTCIYNI